MMSGSSPISLFIGIVPFTTLRRNIHLSRISFLKEISQSPSRTIWIPSIVSILPSFPNGIPWLLP